MPAPAAVRADYLPPPGTLRFAGAHAVAGGRSRAFVIAQTTRAAGDGRRVDIERETLEGDSVASLASQGSERYVAELRDGAVHVGLAADGVHEVPPPVRELPVPPAKDATWRAGPIACTIESIADAETFAGPRRGCAVVRQDHLGGVTRTWHDPELGVVRLEQRTSAGALVLGWALCGPALPTDGEVARAFPLSH